MNRIRDLANTETKQFGIDVVDVRIKRTDLPAENSQAIYRRMQTEREREAKELRAQGAELAQRIRARADRERRVIIAEAQKEAEIIRGQGDAKSVRIFADAVGRDVDFFTFYRSMQAYRDALADDNTSFVLSPDSEFFRFFNNPTLAPVEQARSPGSAPAAAGIARRCRRAATTQRSSRGSMARRPRRRSRRRRRAAPNRTRRTQCPRRADGLEALAKTPFAGCAPRSTITGRSGARGLRRERARVVQAWQLSPPTRRTIGVGV